MRIGPCVAISLGLVFTFLMPLSAAADDTVLAQAKSLAQKGKHKQVVELLDATFSNEWPLEARVTKADSLVALGRHADAFAALEPAAEALRATINKVGKSLPATPLRVVTRPPGAAVSVGDEPAGESPFSMTLPPGFYTVSATLDKFAVKRKEVFLRPGKGRFLSWDLNPTTGTLEITVDDTGLSARVGGTTYPLKLGKNTIPDVAGGPNKVLFLAKGQPVGSRNLVLTAGAIAQVSYKTKALLKTPWADAEVELMRPEGAVPADDEDTIFGKEIAVPPGTWTVVVRRPGHYPVKGHVTVKAGDEATLNTPLEPLEDRTGVETWSVIGIAASVAFIATATVLELSDIEEEDGIQAAKVSLASVGGVLLVTSGSLLKWARSDRDDPSPRDGVFTLSAGALRGGGFLSAGGSF